MLDWGLNAGLVSKRQKGDGYYDFFRSRLMVPIRAPEGRSCPSDGCRAPRHTPTLAAALARRASWDHPR